MNTGITTLRFIHTRSKSMTHHSLKITVGTHMMHHRQLLRQALVHWDCFFGLVLHTLIDGSALAASVAAGAEEGSTAGLIGLGTFMAILLHKPLDALAITSMLTVQGWSPTWITRLNLIFALVCPAGALAFFTGVNHLTGAQPVIGAALGFSAGMFLCIALADVLPEVQFHRHDKIKLSAAILSGVLLAVLIGIWEPDHVHDHDHEHGQPPAPQREHAN